MFVMLVVVGVQAKGWDQQQYKQIEQSIRMPQFADKDYVITKYGAKATNTAAKNQKAIQKAIDKCSQKGGGRVISVQLLSLSSATKILFILYIYF